MNYIGMQFRRTDGSDIASVAVPVGAPWLPKAGDRIDICQNTWVSAHNYEDRRRIATVAEVRFELFYTDGGHSEVRYIVVVDDPGVPDAAA